jgi:hypothetical protein
MSITIGTCGNCGGPVVVPDMWGGPLPAPAHCASCGARPQSTYGPIIPMEPAPARPRPVSMPTEPLPSPFPSAIRVTIDPAPELSVTVDDIGRAVLR